MNNHLEIPTIAKQTGISIKELNRLNHNVWYHGTTIKSAENIENQGVLANYNRKRELDFGPGFYLTDSHERATSYISRAPVITPEGNIETRDTWAIIEFYFNPFILLFSPNSQYRYCNFPKHDDEFANFVLKNRLCSTTDSSLHSYDIIWGVMSDNNPFQITEEYRKQLIDYETAISKLQKPNSMRQLYIGNQNICNLLKINKISSLGN